MGKNLSQGNLFEPELRILLPLRQEMNDKVSDRLKEIFGYIAPNYNIAVEEWNHDKDHVHVLFKGYPNTGISKIINVYKLQAADR
jgi:REP element-mobilizing transposase RayT